MIADGDKAVRRVVKLGFVDGDETEIVSGIDASDRVIDKGQRGLKDGDPINVVDGAAAALFGNLSTAKTTAG